MSAVRDRASVEAPARLRLAVIGGGYVGLVTAACLAERGHRLSILEVSAERRAAIRKGRVPFFEPGLQPLIAAASEAGTLTAMDDPVALGGHDAVLVCVGTPLDDRGEADLSQVESACRAIARHSSGSVVVIRSTLPIGSTPLVAEWLDRPDMRNVVSNPEFLRQGTAVNDFRSPTRVVIGTADGRPNSASDLVAGLHAGAAAPVLVTTYATADMIKNAANAFLATKLSFINEVADLCEAYDADVEQVAAGIGLDPRIGGSYLRPGIGFGGSCLPKELANLMHLGQRRGLPVRLLHAASQENGGRARRLCQRLDRLTGGLAGRRVAVLGLSFKPDTDDLRHSPALAMVEALLGCGARVVAHDPIVPADRTAHVAGLERADIIGALSGAELVVLATEWREYLALDWAALYGLVARPLLFDGRNALDRQALESAGWNVVRIGERSGWDGPHVGRGRRVAVGPGRANAHRRPTERPGARRIRRAGQAARRCPDGVADVVRERPSQLAPRATRP